MAFAFDANNANGANGGAEVMFDFKELLVDSGWSIRSSSDGTTYNAAGDQITSKASGAGGMNNDSAWFVVRASAALTPRREFMFQRGLSDRSWKCYYSAEDGFVGGLPDAVTPPTSTDQQQIVGSAGAFDTTFFAVNSTYKYHIGADVATPYGWYVFAAVNGTGVLSAVMLYDPLTPGSYPSADEDPCVLHFANGASALSTATLITPATAPRAWYKKDLGGETFVRIPALTYEDDTSEAVPSNTGSNPYDSDQNHFPMAYARRAGLATQVGWKGFGSVLRWVGATPANLDTFTTAGVKDRVVMGTVVLPWPNLVPDV